MTTKAAPMGRSQQRWIEQGYQRGYQAALAETLAMLDNRGEDGLREWLTANGHTSDQSK